MRPVPIEMAGAPRFTVDAIKIPFTCAGVKVGVLVSISAATPAMWGVAMLVPLSMMKFPAGSTTGPSAVPTALHEVMLTPGAVMSGLGRAFGVGPMLVKLAMASALSLAATVITERA